MEIPEGAKTVTTEGSDLKTALLAAAQELGVDEKFVAHKLDLSHFRSATGGMVPRTTVRIIAWAQDEEVPRKSALSAVGGRGGARRRDARGRDERKDSRGRDERKDRRGKRKERPRREEEPRGKSEESSPRRRGAEAQATEASDFAASWMQALIGHLGLEGTVTGTGSDERVHLDLQIKEKAGRLIGKRGSTLRSVRRLLKDALKRHYGPLELDVDVNDERPREARPAEAEEPSGGRKRRRRSRGGRGERGHYPEEKLIALANKAAEKAIESGKTITVQLDLNSYDRRVVHMAVAEHEGVRSHSEERVVTDADGREKVVKYVQVIPEGADEGAEE